MAVLLSPSPWWHPCAGNGTGPSRETPQVCAQKCVQQAHRPVPWCLPSKAAASFKGPGAPQDQGWGRGLCQQGETMVSSSEPHVRHGERPWPRRETGPSHHRGRGGGRNHRPKSPPPPGRLGPPLPGTRAGSLLGKGSGLGHSRAGDRQGPDLLSSANPGPRRHHPWGREGRETRPRPVRSAHVLADLRAGSPHPTPPPPGARLCSAEDCRARFWARPSWPGACLREQKGPQGRPPRPRAPSCLRGPAPHCLPPLSWSSWPACGSGTPRKTTTGLAG